MFVVDCRMILIDTGIKLPLFCGLFINYHLKSCCFFPQKKISVFVCYKLHNVENIIEKFFSLKQKQNKKDFDKTKQNANDTGVQMFRMLLFFSS